MHVITFLPAAVTITAAAGQTILAAARQAGVLLESPCNGSGFCGKCKVRVAPAYLSRLVRRSDACITAGLEEQGLVLACLAEVHGDITVELLAGTEAGLEILTTGNSRHVTHAPAVIKRYDAPAGCTVVEKDGRVLAQEAGDTGRACYGAVIDIGTTTLVLAIADLISGRELASVSALNPQSLHGQDVLSRIQFAAGKAGLALLYQSLAAEISRLLKTAAAQAGIDVRHVYEIVYSGNTCMLHLATGVNPKSLGQYPYTPVIRGDCYLPAGDCLLAAADSAEVYLPPIISAYVGADISTGLLAVELKEQPGLSLFVDIGTNGEMALANNGRISAASTAAGPAFEGMNIACGMRASLGAVEHAEITAAGQWQVTTIGQAPATGICGSGLLDIAGELVKHGGVARNGRFAPADKLPGELAGRLITIEGKPAFRVAGAVYLSQKDLRQIQLAKGAIRAGIELLLRSQGAQAADVDRVLIAGSFGYHLRAESLLNIGLLPPEFAGKISFVGNTSKTGGMALLCSRQLRQELAQLVREIEVVELSQYEDFDKVFVSSLTY
jgi:uncharacterized 2Fe-2S/4Fe-4S cluster protein (DUF4445 family)